MHRQLWLCSALFFASLSPFSLFLSLHRDRLFCCRAVISLPNQRKEAPLKFEKRCMMHMYKYGVACEKKDKRDTNETKERKKRLRLANLICSCSVIYRPCHKMPHAESNRPQSLNFPPLRVLPSLTSPFPPSPSPSIIFVTTSHLAERISSTSARGPSVDGRCSDHGEAKMRESSKPHVCLSLTDRHFNVVSGISLLAIHTIFTVLHIFLLSFHFMPTHLPSPISGFTSILIYPFP